MKENHLFYFNKHDSYIICKKKEVQKYKYLQESKKYLRALSDFLLQKKLEMPRNMAAQRAG